MRRLALLAALACAAAAVAAAPAGATNECHGFPVCVPVAGPWVLARTPVQYQLSCPSGYVVAGLDAELSTRAIEVGFLGGLGTPVNPGITTASSALFLARLAGRPDPAASFRPHIGCIPSSGGGQRVPTAYRAYPPAKPAARLASELRVRTGTHRFVRSCRAGARLVSATHAIAFYTAAPPSRALARSVSVAQSVEGASVHLTVRAGQAVAGVRAVVQVDLFCVRDA